MSFKVPALYFETHVKQELRQGSNTNLADFSWSLLALRGKRSDLPIV
jgi:hypothetical protein